ncbi:type IV pilin-like G/H family protein [Microcoleus sp. bin38.metabat.b11b12b14.051]|uniref:type IV pilin-like G/H family protein n=1 Tax=Microcoleus sp. bin38.metabat.b11b12b14.051 TaxID=2742709 RepID=UPI0025FA8EBF|nr:type IV pilin-like G/H family protein [Microcoleus sp. bin38.metabat.b11b12b14.051]
MKTELKAKFLHHLNQKRQDKGFTLIELLVVIIIIGILSAIALPSFLNQANKAKQSEAKQYTGSMNRAQQAKYAENGAFITSVDSLGMGIKTQTSNYTYTIDGANAKYVGNQAISVSDSLLSYTGTVALVTPTGQTDATTIAVLCQANTVGKTALATSVATATSLTCTNGSEVTK